MSERFDAIEVKSRLAFLDLIAHEGVAVRRNGPNFIAQCPFHEERSGSFTIHGPKHDHGHCYGCGWNGDIFDFWMERHGGVFVEAVAACASLASVSPAVFDAKRKKASRVTRMADDAPRPTRTKPTLPRLRPLTEGEIEALARSRNLDALSVGEAARQRRVGACEWPQFEDRDGCWRKPCATHFFKCRMDRADCAPVPSFPCWFVTDAERRVIQFRRLDGEKFEKKDGKPIKAWTKGSPTWPVGASEIGERMGVLLVEGGPDLLAGYHFLHQFRRLRETAVVGMLGASCAICEEALPYFRRRRVRIMMHVDEPNVKTGKIPSFEAAARWSAQLTEVGAVVESFSLTGLTRKSGEPVEDLNDLTTVDEAAWLDPELRAAFFDFDF